MTEEYDEQDEELERYDIGMELVNNGYLHMASVSQFSPEKQDYRPLFDMLTQVEYLFASGKLDDVILVSGTLLNHGCNAMFDAHAIYVPADSELERYSLQELGMVVMRDPDMSLNENMKHLGYHVDAAIRNDKFLQHITRIRQHIAAGHYSEIAFMPGDFAMHGEEWELSHPINLMYAIPADSHPNYKTRKGKFGETLFDRMHSVTATMQHRDDIEGLDKRGRWL